MKREEKEEVARVYKRCPYCLVKLPLEAKECFHCSEKVGRINKHGLANKPVNYMGYLLTIIIWSGLAWFIWWAFYKN